MNPWLTSTVKNYKHYFGEPSKPVVWEVGSRDGDDGEELARRIYDGRKEWFWDNAKIVVFEPNPDQAKIIRERYPEMTVIEMAASNHKGKADFKVYHGDQGAVGSSSLHMDWKGDDLEGHVIEVDTKRLDELIGDETIDIMKIDVEGHSLPVLEGLGAKLKQIRVMHVETETWTGSDQAVKTFMKERGWTLVDEMEQYGGMPDLVFVNSAILSGSAE
jgi:FkbM family methyltransferase